MSKPKPEQVKYLTQTIKGMIKDGTLNELKTMFSGIAKEINATDDNWYNTAINFIDSLTNDNAKAKAKTPQGAQMISLLIHEYESTIGREPKTLEGKIELCNEQIDYLEKELYELKIYKEELLKMEEDKVV